MGNSEFTQTAFRGRREVCGRVGCGDDSLDTLMRDHNFPQPVPISTMRGNGKPTKKLWDTLAVEAWIENLRRTAAEAQAAPVAAMR